MMQGSCYHLINSESVAGTATIVYASLTMALQLPTSHSYATDGYAVLYQKRNRETDLKFSKQEVFSQSCLVNSFYLRNYRENLLL